MNKIVRWGLVFSGATVLAWASMAVGSSASPAPNPHVVNPCAEGSTVAWIDVQEESVVCKVQKHECPKGQRYDYEDEDCVKCEDVDIDVTGDPETPSDDGDTPTEDTPADTTEDTPTGEPEVKTEATEPEVCNNYYTPQGDLIDCNGKLIQHAAQVTSSTEVVIGK